jgi:hypothetical protein
MVSWWRPFGIPFPNIEDLQIIQIIKQDKSRLVAKVKYEGNVYILKSDTDPVENYREVKALQLAQKMLRPSGIRTPELYSFGAKGLLIENIEGQPNPQDPISISLAVQSLLRLHHTPLSNRKKLPNHYYSDNLIRRVHYEKSWLIKTIPLVIDKVPELGDMMPLIEGIPNFGFDQEPVVGHGDFQPKNLICSKDTIVPIDWKDFGLATRWYDLGALINKIPTELKLPTIQEYIEGYKPSLINKLPELTLYALKLSNLMGAGHQCRILFADSSDNSALRKLTLNYKSLLAAGQAQAD